MDDDDGEEDNEVAGSKRFDAVILLEYENGGVRSCE